MISDVPPTVSVRCQGVLDLESARPEGRAGLYHLTRLGLLTGGRVIGKADTVGTIGPISNRGPVVLQEAELFERDDPRAAAWPFPFDHHSGPGDLGTSPCDPPWGSSAGAGFLEAFVQFFEGFGFDLPDPFAGQAQGFANFFQGMRFLVIQPKTEA